jgi:pimeloyl-ACP methyl ester carboxylesterase
MNVPDRTRRAVIRPSLPFLRSWIKRMGLIEEGNGSVSLTDLFRFSRVRFEPNPPPATLLAEPVPADATLDLGTLVLVHGNYWKDAIGQNPAPSERTFLFEPLRNDPRFAEVRRRYRVFLYQYPTHLDVGHSATVLQGLLRNVLPATAAKPDLTVIAHSLGGLVARWALQAPDLTGRLADLITLAAPHHGTVLASLVMANAKIREKVGLFGLFCQRMSRRVWPMTPGLEGMTYDNHDGLIPPADADRFGVFLNGKLAQMNRACQVAAKMTCLMGRVRHLEWLENRNLFDQVPRIIMGRENPVYRGLDPLVHLESGLAMGLSVKARHALDGLDHETIATSQASRDLVLQLLLARA